MRPATYRTICLFACGLLLLSAGMAGAQPWSRVGGAQCGLVSTTTRAAAPLPARPIGQQVYRDRKTNAAFFFSATGDGGARMTVTAGDLEVEKIVYADGRFRLTLQAEDDVVSIAGAPGTLEVARGKQRGRSLDVGRASQDDWLKLKVALAGSKAHRLFRALANNLEDATLQTPAGTAVLLTDGVLALLDGDPGVVRRLGERWRPVRQVRIRPAALQNVPEFLACWVNYEVAIYQAYQEYGQCRSDDWLWQLLFYACDWEYVLKAESIWFQFVGCSMFPI